MPPTPKTKSSPPSSPVVGKKLEPAFTATFYIPPIVTRGPDGSVTVRAGKPVILGGEDEITSAQAAAILGCGVSWIGSLCDRGTLAEGVDWRRIGTRGNYKIKRASVIKLAGVRQQESAA